MKCCPFPEYEDDRCMNCFAGIPLIDKAGADTPVDFIPVPQIENNQPHLIGE